MAKRAGAFGNSDKTKDFPKLTQKFTEIKLKLQSPVAGPEYTVTQSDQEVKQSTTFIVDKVLSQIDQQQPIDQESGAASATSSLRKVSAEEKSLELEEVENPAHDSLSQIANEIKQDLEEIQASEDSVSPAFIDETSKEAFAELPAPIKPNPEHTEQYSLAWQVGKWFLAASPFIAVGIGIYMSNSTTPNPFGNNNPTGDTQEPWLHDMKNPKGVCLPIVNATRLFQEADTVRWQPKAVNALVVKDRISENPAVNNPLCVVLVKNTAEKVDDSFLVRSDFTQNTNHKTYLEFIKALDPKIPVEAAKIMTGDKTELKKDLFFTDKEKYLGKLYKKRLLSVHPDKCKSNECKEALDKLKEAKKVLLSMKNQYAFFSQSEIDFEIKNSNFDDLSNLEVFSLFSFDINSKPNCGEEEMRRRVSLLSTEQTIAMLQRFGWGDRWSTENGVMMGSIKDYLSESQLIDAFNAIDFSIMSEGDFRQIIFFGRCKKWRNHYLTKLSNLQVKACMNRGRYNNGLSEIWSNLQQQQQRDYIQTLDNNELQMNLDTYLQNGEVFTEDQVKFALESFNHFSHVKRAFTQEQIEVYTKSIDMKRINETILLDLVHVHPKMCDWFSETQWKDAKERFCPYGGYFGLEYSCKKG